MADAKKSKIKYSEPSGYFPKDIQKMFDTKSATTKKKVKKSK